jgi:hypothetical protein
VLHSPALKLQLFTGFGKFGQEFVFLDGIRFDAQRCCEGFLTESSIESEGKVSLVVKSAFDFPTITGIFLGHYGDSCSNSCNYAKNYAFIINAFS